MILPRTLFQISEDPRVSGISDERALGDGIWVYLKQEYRDFDFDPGNPSGVIHEQTVKELCGRFKGVKHI